MKTAQFQLHHFVSHETKLALSEAPEKAVQEMCAPCSLGKSSLRLCHAEFNRAILEPMAVRALMPLSGLISSLVGRLHVLGETRFGACLSICPATGQRVAIRQRRRLPRSELICQL